VKTATAATEAQRKSELATETQRRREKEKHKFHHKNTKKNIFFFFDRVGEVLTSHQ